MKETLIHKTRPIIILTIILTIVFNKLLNQLLTREVSAEGGLYSSYTIHFSLGMYGIVLAIPAFIVSIFMVKIFLDWTNKKSADYVANRSEFKWYSMYGTVIGLVIFVLLSQGMTSYTSDMQVHTLWEGFQWAGMVLIIPAALAILAALLMNRIMIRLTNTNGRLIEKIAAGQYDERFKDEENKQRVLNLLEKGRVSTITGAVWRLRIRDVILMITGSIILVLMTIVEFFSPSGSSSSSGGGSNYYIRKNELETKLRKQKEKTAAAKKEYIKQMNYNSDTIFAQNRADDLERELRKQKELEELNKRF